MAVVLFESCCGASADQAPFRAQQVTGVSFKHSDSTYASWRQWNWESRLQSYLLKHVETVETMTSTGTLKSIRRCVINDGLPLAKIPKASHLKCWSDLNPAPGIDDALDFLMSSLTGDW